MNLTSRPPSQNSHAVRWHCTSRWHKKSLLQYNNNNYYYYEYTNFPIWIQAVETRSMLGLLSTNDVQNGEQDHTHRNAEKHANYHRQHDTYISHTHTHTHTPVTRPPHATNMIHTTASTSRGRIKNQFLCVRLFIAWQNLVNFFTYIKESISYNSVYLILACVTNFG